MLKFLISIIFLISFPLNATVKLGIEVLIEGQHPLLLKGKRIGLLTNHTAVNSEMESTWNLLKKYSQKAGFTITTLFAPEHGITGASHSDELIYDEYNPEGIPIYSLHGKTKRPTKEMLDKIDILIYDIQDIGSRSYTYATTLFYAMEEAAKQGKKVVVLDRPNPINGVTIDGPILEEKWRSIVGYVNVPYCHGMTIGELAKYFNSEYQIQCQLEVIPMKGWKREMTFKETGLHWIPTSPHIPESETVWYYPTTGILGELQIVNIGVGYTLPFKVVGAPWIDAEAFAKSLNSQRFPGVVFHPIHYKPFYGTFAKQDCHGVMIVITDYTIYKPVTTQYLIIGILKSLYPNQFEQAMQRMKHRQEMFCKVNGTKEVCDILQNEKYVTWKLKELHETERDQFYTKRQKYLIYNTSRSSR